jgi:hypothetical protein
MTIRALSLRSGAVLLMAGALLAGPGVALRPSDSGDRSGVCVGAVGALACVPPDSSPTPPTSPTLPGS